MAGSGFGEHLKREREMRGVSLEEIASATRISVRFLTALEQESWDRLPGGVFNRGFVRTISRYLGLEEDSLLAEYSLAIGEKAATASVPAELPKQTPAAQGNRPWLSIVVVLLIAAIGVGAWYGWAWYAARRAELAGAESATPERPTPPSAPQNLQTNTAAETGLPAEPQAAAANPDQELELKIDATKDTQLAVTSDGQTVFSGTLAAGQSRTVRATTSLTIDAQDAGAVQLELNGQPLVPIGPAGQPGRLTIGHPATPDGTGGHD